MISKNQIKHLYSLLRKKNRQKFQQVILEGQRLIEESIKAGADIEYFCFTENIKNKISNNSLLSQIQSYMIHGIDLNKISDTKTSQGIIALVSTKKYTNTNLDLLNGNNLVILDGIQDPGNLGNLFRSALAGEYEVIWLASGADPLNQKVLRSSAGSVLHMPFERIGDSSSSSIEMLVSKLNIAIDDNYQVVGTISPNKITDKKVKPYWELDWDLPTVLVLGNEGSGVHASIEACCTDFVTLPHSSLVDSLNVASAAVPLLLERQRVKMVKGIQKKS